FRAGQGVAVRLRYADAGWRDGWRIRLGFDRRLHPVFGTDQGPELKDPAVRPWPAVRHAAGRRADRNPALPCPAGRHRATVRCAGCALEFRPDHAIGARPQQARRLTVQVFAREADMRPCRGVMIATLALGAALSSPTQKALAEPKADVAAATSAWGQALTDPDKVSSLYSDDAVLWGTAAPKVRSGRTAVREYFAGVAK